MFSLVISGLRNKIKKTNIEKYGVEYSLQSSEVREKGKITCLENYGVENCSQLDEIKDKLDIMDWVAIAEIITSRSDEFEMNDDESKDYDKCDECGNYGYSLVYNKKDETNL